jgi:hypothetical protein
LSFFPYGLEKKLSSEHLAKKKISQAWFSDSYALRACTEELLGSLNAQAQAPYDMSQALLDSHMLSLHAYMEILLGSFNDQE